MKTTILYSILIWQLFCIIPSLFAYILIDIPFFESLRIVEIATLLIGGGTILILFLFMKIIDND